MKYELKKCISSPFIKFVLAVLFVMNVMLCVFQLGKTKNGISWEQIAEKYAYADDVEEELQSLEKQIISGETLDENGLSTDNVYRERAILREVHDRVEYQINYPAIREQTVQDAQSKLESMIFSDLFNQRCLNKTIDVYSKLQGIVPVKVFTGSLEVFFSGKHTDMCMAIMVMLTGLLLIVNEKTSGMIILLKPLKYGKLRLYFVKFLTACCIIIFSSVILYGSALLVDVIFLGRFNPSLPIQMVYGFHLCPYGISAWQAVLLYVSVKTLWFLALSSCFLMICTGANSRMSSLLISLGFVSISLIFFLLPSLQSRTFNILSGIYLKDIISANFYIDLFSHPINQLYSIVIFLFLIVVASFWLGAKLHCLGRLGVSHDLSKRHRFYPLETKPRGPFAYEMRKLFFSCRGLLALLVLLLFQLIAYTYYYSIQLNDYQISYRTYSMQLEGLPSQGKDSILRSETERFDDLRAELRYYSETVSLDNPAYVTVTQGIVQQLSKEQAFLDVKGRYESLRPNQAYVYDAGWNRLYNSLGVQDDLRNFALVSFILIIILSEIYTFEFETGVFVLQSGPRQQRMVRRQKLHVTTLFLAMAMTLSFMPQYIMIYHIFGFHQFWTAANTLQIFSSLPDFVSLAGILCITTLCRVFLVVVEALIIYVMALKLKRALPTILGACSVIMLPILAAIVSI